MVEYRVIPWREPYMAGDDGSIVSRLGKVLKQSIGGRGYRCFRYSSRGQSITVASHVAVCSAFHGPRPEGMEVAHLNGDKTDNRAINLAWKTPAQNASDKRSHGTHREGETVPVAKLTEDTVRKLRRGEMTTRDAMDLHGVAQSTVWNAKHGKTWRHVADDGITYTMTSGEVSEAIDAAIAARTIDPLVAAARAALAEEMSKA